MKIRNLSRPVFEPRTFGLAYLLTMRPPRLSVAQHVFPGSLTFPSPSPSAPLPSPPLPLSPRVHPRLRDDQVRRLQVDTDIRVFPLLYGVLKSGRRLFLQFLKLHHRCRLKSASHTDYSITTTLFSKTLMGFEYVGNIRQFRWYD